MNRKHFSELATQGYNRIPVSRCVLADMDTPLSAYLKLADGPYSYLFESVQGGEKWSLYSIIGLPCRTVLKVQGQGSNITIETDGDVVETLTHNDPLEFVKQFQARFKVAESEAESRFNGGLVGYFGYDAVRYIELKLRHVAPLDTIENPDHLLMVSDEVIAFDNLEGTLTLTVHVDPSLKNAYDVAQDHLDALTQKLPLPTPQLTEVDITKKTEDKLNISEQDFKSNFTQVEFEASVERIKQYTLAGDVMQVVPSQRMAIPFKAPPINLYRALRNLNPSPYMYYLNLSDFHIVGSSPEILARVEKGNVTVRPLAGARRRGYSDEEDQSLEQELLANPKEIAEHLMLIDLGRNDVAKISDIVGVQVTDKMTVEKYSHVMHIVSNVVGRLKTGMSSIDVLRATLPAGTLSGAPKIRAMEIIDKLEPVNRGVYGSAVGYISWNDNMDTASC